MVDTIIIGNKIGNDGGKATYQLNDIPHGTLAPSLKIHEIECGKCGYKWGKFVKPENIEFKCPDCCNDKGNILHTERYKALDGSKVTTEIRGTAPVWWR